MKKAILLLFLLAMAAAADGYVGWAVNPFLAIMFTFNFAGYQEWVAAGVPCVAWIGGGVPDSPQPVCPYDSSNTNPGYIPPAGN